VYGYIHEDYFRGTNQIFQPDNFKPGAFDSTRPATIEIKKGEENTQVFAEFPSKEVIIIVVGII
jgi:hypothetical protein